MNGLVKRLIADAAHEWDLPQKTILAIVCLPSILALSGVAAALMGKDAYKWFTGEDGFAENMQVLFLVLAFVLSLTIVRQLWKTRDKGIALLYLGVSMALFFLIGEEISWGQRIFGWETPESIKAISKQPETNIHNIYGVWDLFKWMQLLVGAYGTLLPLLFLRWPVVARYRKTLSLLVPHYVLIPYFLFLFVWRIYRNLFEPPKKYYFVIWEFNEVLELILYVGVVLFMIFQLRQTRQTEVPSPARS